MSRLFSIHTSKAKVLFTLVIGLLLTVPSLANSSAEPLPELGDSAAAIEASLKSGTQVGSEALLQLRDAVEVTAESQRQLAPLYGAPEDASELDENRRRELLQELLQAVATNDPAAGDLAEQLVAATANDNDDYNTLCAVRDALQMYDFPTAVELLDSVTSDAAG